MDRQARRSLIATEPNPGSRLDYVVSLDGHMAPPEGPRVAVSLRYVPDRLVAAPPSFGRYLEALAGLAWPGLEAIAVTVLDDLNNELVPRWLQVTVEAAEGAHPGIDRHGVMLEERQPRWDNPVLLSRLRRY
jgi:7-cyano-7-deazaguanine reductase